ncbi:MAG TPA: MEDS domain-containing protein [Acidimicrobiia bacterium]|nr:MEDS domain-containing protein [Acidimicrobiia bacterium]
MSASRVGDCLKAARTRLGWSREALAYHSGVSWAAIAQIESGRRNDVRLSTLSALAAALGVTVDYLVGGSSTVAPRLLEHRVLLYGSDEDFAAGTVPFLTDGVTRSDARLVVTTPRRIRLVQKALAAGSDEVEFASSASWYRSPVEAMRRYHAFVSERFAAGAGWVRIIGEPVWVGRSEAEMAAWTRYESLINVALASAPATIVCPYDTTAVPATVLAGAHCTHPQVTHEGGTTANRRYREPEKFLLEAGSVTTS